MYLDTSTLFAFYILETKSHIAEELIKTAENIFLSPLTDVEFYSALKKRNRIGEISEEDVQETYSLFKSHRNQLLYSYLSIKDEDFRTSEVVLSATSTALRTLDALHLGIAKNNEIPIFTFDKVLIQAASELGIQTINYSG